ncbi:hypothetical protein [uncultured Arsenicicoccus sp.]|uniref:hypothetical protein n=1 Tax=uncultured Arsenicicoccus sp. TaxID=491339 RepID=UPI0025968C70|nr:hypothetical protein [uncultured Arsenicicoccus sp.]
MTTQQPEEPSVMDQAQDGDAGQVSRSGLYPTQDESRTGQSGDADETTPSTDGDDPELAGADLDEDQSEGRGPTIEPGA